ncbi:MAG: cobalamin B12-binding domain-containing protein [Anaerolineae bacterium]|nr:cobalamin B12-binding domain-containing protein [Anaerolineae bacterium]
MSEELVKAIVEMREQDALQLTRDLLDGGSSPLDILDDCRAAMEVVGRRFETGEAFIPELILAGEMLKQISELIKPRLEAETVGEEKLGTVVLGTVEGDIHDIAKDIVGFMLDINGFKVIDLGVDVPPARFVEAVRESGAKIVALSGFLTLAYDPMKATVAALKEAGFADVKVMIGGGQIDDHICEYTGADAWGRDAMAAVNLARQWS